jgi:hypothetical protein
MIASLEDELRVRLLQRSTRRMTLTEVGAKYLGRIEPLLEEIDQARDEALARSVRPIGTIRITGRCVSRCPFIGAKQKSRGSAPTSEFDPNETWTHGRRVVPRCRAGLEYLRPSAQLIVTGTVLMWNNIGTLALGALADRSPRVQAQLILGTDPSLIREV